MDDRFKGKIFFPTDYIAPVGLTSGDYADRFRKAYDESRITHAVHKKRDGFLLVRSDGLSRFLGLWESIKYRLGLLDLEKIQ